VPPSHPKVQSRSFDTVSSEAGSFTASGSRTSSDVVIGVTTSAVVITLVRLYRSGGRIVCNETCTDLFGLTYRFVGFGYKHSLSRRVPARHRCRALVRRQSFVPQPHTNEVAF